MWKALYDSYKEIVSKLWNVNTTVWYVQANCFKAAEYEYQCMLVKKELSQSCGIWISLYGSCKEIVSELLNMNTIIW